MNEELKKDEGKPKAEVCVLPPILTFKGIRRVIMENVWKKADELEKKGKPLTSVDFSRMLKAEWKLMKAEKIPEAVREYEICRKLGGIEKIVDGLIAEDEEELTKLGVR